MKFTIRDLLWFTTLAAVMTGCWVERSNRLLEVEELLLSHSYPPLSHNVEHPPISDRFMKFTIRDLLWLTLLAAVAVAWWLDRGRLASQLDAQRPPKIKSVPLGVFRPRTGAPMNIKPRIVIDETADEPLTIDLSPERPPIKNK